VFAIVIFNLLQVCSLCVWYYHQHQHVVEFIILKTTYSLNE